MFINNNDEVIYIVMGWNKDTRKVESKIIFDVKVPEMDFSLDSVFGELKSELKEEKIRKTKQVRKRLPTKTKPKSQKIVEEKKPLKSVQDIASKLDNLEKSHPVLTEKTNDPLALVNTPEYMTQKEFQKHYKLLLDRVQIQLGSLGGGGAVAIRDMEDVETAFISDPSSLDGATMKMRYNPIQKVLQFYGDTSVGGGTTTFIENTGGVLDILGTNSQINLTSVGGTFTASFSDTIITPGTFESVGVTTLASDGDETATGGNLRVSGTTNATKFSTTSDERLKKNIKKIEDPLQVLSNIEGVKFNWISDGSDDVGVIAQDVERCLPEAVNENNDVKSVNYNGIVGLLVESVKELSKDNQLLRMEIESLKHKL
jgi:hypothetical protein